MRRVIFSLILILINQFLFAQTEDAFYASLKSTSQDTLDRARVCVHYRQAERQNSLDTSKFIFSEMILQIGERCSNYTNYVRLWSDSIRAYEREHGGFTPKERIHRAAARTTNCGDSQTVFKNYPKGKYMVQNLVFLDRYLYEEDIPRFHWKLDTGTLTWLGYACQKATCDFRGRHYVAWYAPEIAVNNGPWKFYGLPGLILKVEDSRGDYVFEATELYQVTWYRPIYYVLKSNQMKVTRERFLQAQRRDMENPVAALQNSGRIIGEVKGAILKKCQFNPIELE